MKILSPRSEQDFEQYYDLRWRILRKPWQQPRGSEKDELEDNSYHVMALDDHGSIMGCGRLHFTTQDQAQIRYMAVEPDSEKQGIGSLLLQNMESFAKQHGANEIVLHAREHAVGFYKKMGYSVTEKSHVLFGAIQHYRMHKIITHPD